MFETAETYKANKSQIELLPDMAICQTDYPLDWYQAEFTPYAESFLSLPDRKIETIIEWMTPYVESAYEAFGDKLLLVAHYYMGGEIVKLVEHFGGFVGDSYQLAVKAKSMPEKSIIVESAVHFMAESISLLAHPHQSVYITNPKAGCTMEMMAKDFMVEPALTTLNERYGRENILPICYMNTSGRVKAMCGAQGGAVCTSSNVLKIARWAISQGKKVLFIPDRHMGENIAYWLDIPKSKLAYWPGGTKGAQYNFDALSALEKAQFDEAPLVLFDSYCAVHTHYTPQMIAYWQTRGFATIAHPECQNSVVKIADAHGSTAKIWSYVMNDEAKTKRYAVATENHMVENIKQQAKAKGISVASVADADIPNKESVGCGCATMSRNDPPHLVGILDLLVKGQAPQFNLVKPGDVVGEFSGIKQSVDNTTQAYIRENAEKALLKMIEITES